MLWDIVLAQKQIDYIILVREKVRENFSNTTNPETVTLGSFFAHQ